MPPKLTRADSGVTVTVPTGIVVTANSAWPLCPSTVPAIVAPPTASAVTNPVAEQIVDLLKTVQVDQKDRYLLIGSFRAQYGLPQAVLKNAALGQIGERIRHG